MKKLVERMDQLSKLSLESHDSIREIQHKLGYVCYIMPSSSKVVEAVEEEIVAFRKLTQAARDKAEEKDEPPELMGAQAAHIFPAAVEALLVNFPACKSDEDTKHRLAMTEILSTMNQSASPDDCLGAIGTFLFRKGYGDKCKFVVNHNLFVPQADGLNYFFIKNGAERKVGKPSRSGVARGVRMQLGSSSSHSRTK